jgi:hypothetical protein
VLLDALLPDLSSLAHRLQAIHEELGRDGQETNGNRDDTQANPRVGFRIGLRKVALLFLQGIGSGWVECESIVLTGRVGKENARADVAEVW